MLRSSAAERDLPETWKAARRRAFPDASAGPSDGGTSPGSGLAKRLVLRVGTYHGKIFDLPPVKIAPVPSAPIPVLIGGHSDAALRRAARLGAGWRRGGGDLPGLLAPPHAPPRR